MNIPWWRRWHRWIGAVAAVFLIFVSITGVLVAITEFFGEEEARREATRGLVSDVPTSTSTAASEALARALATAAATAPNAPVDSITMRLKGQPATVDVFLGRPGGGEDRRLVIDARSGRLLQEATYVDKPFIKRLHSGEAFGDGGLVAAMLWGLSLTAMSVSGIVVYFTMRRPNRTGLQKVFW